MRCVASELLANLYEKIIRDLILTWHTGSDRDRARIVMALREVSPEVGEAFLEHLREYLKEELK